MKYNDLEEMNNEIKKELKTYSQNEIDLFTQSLSKFFDKYDSDEKEWKKFLTSFMEKI